MAMQPIDRKNAKHQHTVAPRVKPQLVRRSNKLVILDHSPRHIATQIDSQITYWGEARYPKFF